jgi:hypothetical protein
MLVFFALVVVRLGASAAHRYSQIDMPTETNDNKMPTFPYAGAFCPRRRATWYLYSTSVSSD